MSKERDKLAQAIDTIATEYHFAQADGSLKDHYFPNNLTLMGLSYVLGKNHVIIGEPGWGKTSGAQVVSSVLSGIPFDLYESLTVEGHPGLFTEKWKARPDYGSLTSGEERVIWQGSFGLDSFIVDEVNRTSPAMQDEMLEGIRTGRWKYLNDVLFEGKKPTFMTMNHHDDGNGDLIPPLRDRLDIITEETAQSPFHDYAAAEQRVREHLSDPEATEQAIEQLRAKKFGGFKETVNNARRDGYITQKELEIMRDQISSVTLTNDAKLFLWTLACEINFNRQYGTKRANDPISDNTHDRQYAGRHVNGSLSARPLRAAQDYASGLAWILGEESVSIDHVRHVLPHVMAHKLQFHEDFISNHGNDLRTDYQDLHLARQLVEGVIGPNGTYHSCILPLRTMIAAIQDGKAECIDTENGVVIKIDGEDKPFDEFDHPLLRHILQMKVLNNTSTLSSKR